jgi:hypothetical protein
LAAASAGDDAAAVLAAECAISAADKVLQQPCQATEDWQLEVQESFEGLDEVCLLLIQACTRLFSCASADVTIIIRIRRCLITPTLCNKPLNPSHLCFLFQALVDIIEPHPHLKVLHPKTLFLIIKTEQHTANRPVAQTPP